MVAPLDMWLAWCVWKHCLRWNRNRDHSTCIRSFQIWTMWWCISAEKYMWKKEIVFLYNYDTFVAFIYPNPDSHSKCVWLIGHTYAGFKREQRGLLKQRARTAWWHQGSRSLEHTVAVSRGPHTFTLVMKCYFMLLAWNEKVTSAGN